DAETGIRGYGLTKRRAFLSPYLEAKKSLPPLLAELKVMVQENKVQAQRFEDIKKSTEQHINFLQNTLNKLDSSATSVQSPEIIEVFTQGKLRRDNLRAKIN
ncbi:CHASE3 domain-containing protein, partial [Microcoleus sp. HI-ES]|nr:CHASE3 domain-containing protein [Microcoleus sp. HI-ES]